MMNYPQRKNIRLQGYDYSQGGVYFCTACVHKMHRHKMLFGNVEDEKIRLNRFGRIVERCWLDLPRHSHNLALDEWVIMPNHFHGLLWLDAPAQTGDFAAKFGPLTPDSLATAIGGFKSAVSKAVGLWRGEKTVVWQIRFHERIVRSDTELLATRRYIQNNPAQWENDRCHPSHPDFERVWQSLSPDPDTL